MTKFVYEIRYHNEDYDDGRGRWEPWDDELYLHEGYAQQIVDKLNADALQRHNETEARREEQFNRQAAEYKVLVDAGFRQPGASYLEKGYQPRGFVPRYEVYQHELNESEPS